MMDFLELEYWCNGYTNPMNTIFTKKSPRFVINLGSYANTNFDSIEYIAHESNEHMVFDLSKYVIPHFNEELPLLYNVEYIYRMHTQMPHKYFLNFYPTIPLERTDIERDILRFPHKTLHQKTYNIKEEETIMKSLGVNWIPHKIVDDLIHRVEDCVNERTNKEK